MADYVEVYMQFWSCFKAWLKQTFFDMKDFNCNYNLIYPTFFRWSFQLFNFIFASKPPSVSFQSHPQDTLRVRLQAKWTIRFFRLKFARKMDLSLEFQKTNVGIRISILEIAFFLIFKQNRQLWLFRSKFAQKWVLRSKFQKLKSGFGISTSKKKCVPISS